MVGPLAAGTGVCALWLGLPGGVAAGLVLAVQILLTGAMHEDGLADSADGLWGGLTRDRRLEIMRDSRIGTYGVLALGLSLGLRWSALAVLLPLGWQAVVVAAVVSRAAMVAVMAALPHARSDGLSRGVGRPGPWAAMAGIGLALVITLGAGITPMAAGLVAALLTGALARRKLGGQTGDILGATQQVAEIAVLLALLLA